MKGYSQCYPLSVDSLINSTLINSTLWAAEALANTVKRMPKEKIEWSPLDQGRTTLSQLQECAIAPDLYLAYLDPTYNRKANSYAEAAALQSQWKTVEECLTALQENTAQLVEAIRNLPPERLSEVHTMPWGEQMTVQGIAGLHYWNMTYHLGQINYIQTLDGDKAMF